MTHRRHRPLLSTLGLTAVLLALTFAFSLRVTAKAESLAPPSEPVSTTAAPNPEPGAQFVAVSSGDFHACALRANGEVVCWGASESGEQKGGHGPVDFGQTRPSGGERFKAIDSGGFHTCGLQQDGTAVCWGAQLGDERAGFGQVGHGQSSPPADQTFVAISSGGAHTCGLREDGVPVCWGSDSSGQASPPEGDPLVSISSGRVPHLRHGAQTGPPFAGAPSPTRSATGNGRPRTR